MAALARPFLDLLVEIRGLLTRPPDHSLSALAARSLSGQPQARQFTAPGAGTQLCPAQPRRVYLAFLVPTATATCICPVSPSFVVPAYGVDGVTPLVFTAHDSPGLVGLDWYWSVGVGPNVGVVEVLCPPR